MILTHHERFNGEWEGCGVEEDLALVGQMRDDAVEHSLEVLRQQLVGLQHITTQQDLITPTFRSYRTPLS